MCFLFLGFGVSGMDCAFEFAFDGAFDCFDFASLMVVLQWKFLFEVSSVFTFGFFKVCPGISRRLLVWLLVCFL